MSASSSESSTSTILSSTSSLTDASLTSGTSVEAEFMSEFPKSIPPTHPARTLVLCFDGTGDQFDSDNSNIVEFVTLLKKDDKEKQMVYYQAGIGTYTSPQIATSFMAKLSKTLDEMIAWNLSAHVMDGYEFLMQNYKAGDRICIFGFSRGAYTARSLAGMIHKVGLLPACNHQQVPFAYKMYTRDDEIGWEQSKAFKKAFSVDVSIEFIGVWDTVNSVGLIPRRLPFTRSNTIVRTFRHAIALDERRAKFQPNYWDCRNKANSTLGIEGEKPNVPRDCHHRNEHCHHHTGRQHKCTRHKKNILRKMERKYSDHDHLGRPTDVEEVWFVGCHCDVGGGSVANGTPHNLARIPLRWMIRECFKAETGIMFISESLETLGLDPANLYPHVLKRPPALPSVDAHIQHIHPSASDRTLESDIKMSEEEHELRDAMSPIYDQLRLAPLWWLLELFPMKRQKRDPTSRGTHKSINLGRGRFIRNQKEQVIKIHRSVKQRMDARYPDGTKYTPRFASFEKALGEGNIQWMD